MLTTTIVPTAAAEKPAADLEFLAELAYEAFRDAMGETDLEGEPAQAFADLADPQKNAFRAAAKAVVEGV